MIEFKLFGNKAYSWNLKENQYFTGYFSDENNLFYSGESAIDFLLNIGKQNTTDPKLNGIYSFIKTTPNGIEITTDTINYFPLFFLKKHDCWFVSDNWNYLVDTKGGIMPNVEVKTEFQSIGFVLDNETLDKEIFKTRAGEKLLLNHDGTLERIPNYFFLPDFFSDDNFHELSELLISELCEAGKRLVKFLDNRTAILPLSGGFDSRLIACILKNHHYENVICFTYGRRNSEVEISRKTAQTLGYKWLFVDYNEIDLENYLDDSCFLEYVAFAGNGFSMPYLQEYFAVKKLVQEAIVPLNSVFLPGHVGDNIAGSYILKSIKTKTPPNKLHNNLIDTYFFFKKNSKDEKIWIKNRISKTLLTYPEKNIYAASYNPFIEDWSVKEKFSKFLFHSSKVFDFWGYETYFLFWDVKLVTFFRNLPFKFRENKLLYDEVATKYFFTKYNVFYSHEEMKTSLFDIKVQIIKNRLRDFFPWKLVLRIMKNHDKIFYSELTSVMEKEMAQNGFRRIKRYRSYNAVICRWYLYFMSKDLNKVATYSSSPNKYIATANQMLSLKNCYRNKRN